MALSRRGFIGSLISFAVAAPAIVRISSIMPVKSFDATSYWLEVTGATKEAFLPVIYAKLYREHPLIYAKFKDAA